MLIKESDKKDGDDEGIKDIVVEINWPMKDHDGNYLLYLSEVRVNIEFCPLVALKTEAPARLSMVGKPSMSSTICILR